MFLNLNLNHLKFNNAYLLIYNFEVNSGTRNHKGDFVQDMVYRLVDIGEIDTNLRDADLAEAYLNEADCTGTNLAKRLI